MVKVTFEDKWCDLYQTCYCYWLKAFPLRTWQEHQDLSLFWCNWYICVKELCTEMTDKLHSNTLFSFSWWFSHGMPVMDTVSFGGCLGVSKALHLARVLTALQSFKWIQKWMWVRMRSKWKEIKCVHKISLIWFYWFEAGKWINTLLTILLVLTYYLRDNCSCFPYGSRLWEKTAETLSGLWYVCTVCSTCHAPVSSRFFF